jgi:hypothetical protein
MYEVDDRDRVVELSDVPQCDAGAPCPAIFATEQHVRVAYYMTDDPNRISPVDMVGVLEEGAGADERVAIVSLPHYALMFGPPNDEAFRGHPLASRGLKPYGAFEILESSWLRRLERMNSVHARHSRERFMQRRHIIFTFHDSTFECITTSYSIEIAKGSPENVVVRRGMQPRSQGVSP